MIKHPLTTALPFITAAILFLGAGGCTKDGRYDGPTVSTVGVGGSYTDKDGETYGGNVNVGLAYPTPTPRPVDHSK